MGDSASDILLVETDEELVCSLLPGNEEWGMVRTSTIHGDHGVLVGGPSIAMLLNYHL